MISWSRAAAIAPAAWFVEACALEGDALIGRAWQACATFMTPCPYHPWLLALLLLLAPAHSLADAKDEHATPGAGDSAELTAFVPGASRLEGRIRAPCCWKTTGQTLDIHGSESALALRREIRQRLRAGESADVIEASIVARYGEGILAVPQQSPLKGFAIGLSLLVGTAGIGAVVMLGRWRRRSQQAKRSKRGSSDSQGRDEMDDRVDEELRRLDE